MPLHPAPGGGSSLFNPASFLTGGAFPSLTGGDAGPAFSEATTGSVNPFATISGAFVIGNGNEVAGGGAPGGGGAGGFGVVTSKNIVFIVGIGLAAWLVLNLRKR